MISPRRGSSSLGRARPCQGRGSGFEARLPLQLLTSAVSSVQPIGFQERSIPSFHNNRCPSRAELHFDAALSTIVGPCLVLH